MNIFSRARKPQVDGKSLDLGRPFESILRSMDNAEKQPGINGDMHEIPEAHRNTKISRQQGEMIHRLYLETKPDLSVEIGLAFGHSTLYMLSAINVLESGHHIAIDPYQHSYGGIGANHAERLGLQAHFTWINERSEHALPAMVGQSKHAQFIFIDGSHLFDNVLVDFFLSSQILDLDGIMIFDDLWMESVRHVVRFIETNRNDYKRLRSDVKEAAVFQKVGEDAREWDHYKSF